MISKYLNTYFQERKKLHEQNVKGGTGISADVFAGITTSLKELKDYVNNYIEKLTSLKCTTNFSLGKGKYTPNQYLSILPPGQKTSNGTYVVFCFSQEGDGCVLGCACSVKGKKTLPEDVVKRAEKVSEDKYQLISNNNINVHK
jgi:hypothetical protein